MRPTHREILDPVCELYDVTLRMLRGPKRVRSILRPRFVAAWLLRNVGEYSYPEIGALLGGRDHATIMSACRRIDGDLRRGALGRYAEWIIEAIGDLAECGEIEDDFSEAIVQAAPRAPEPPREAAGVFTW